MRVVKAFLYSVAGLRAAWRNEPAFREECALVLILTPAAFWVGDTALERSLLIGSCWLVIVIELLNSAVEAIVDRIGTERHELARRAKDSGSAAVLVALVLAGLVWALVLWERFG